MIAFSDIYTLSGGFSIGRSLFLWFSLRGPGVGVNKSWRSLALASVCAAMKYSHDSRFYREQAKECRARAEAAMIPSLRHSYHALAQSFDKLADSMSEIEAQRRQMPAMHPAAR